MNSTLTLLQADYSTQIAQIAGITVMFFLTILGFHRSAFPTWLKNLLAGLALGISLAVYGYLLLAPFLGE